MPLYVRKVLRRKWLQAKIGEGASPSGDACTNCLRTSDNTLSLWAVESSDKVTDGVLALVSGFRMLETIDIVLLTDEEIHQAGLTLNQTKGVTPVKDQEVNHYDIVNLDYDGLGAVTRILIPHFVRESVRRIRLPELVALLKEAIAAGRLNPEDLHADVRERLG